MIEWIELICGISSCSWWLQLSLMTFDIPCLCSYRTQAKSMCREVYEVRTDLAEMKTQRKPQLWIEFFPKVQKCLSFS